MSIHTIATVCVMPDDDVQIEVKEAQQGPMSLWPLVLDVDTKQTTFQLLLTEEAASEIVNRLQAGLQDLDQRREDIRQRCAEKAAGSIS